MSPAPSRRNAGLNPELRLKTRQGQDRGVNAKAYARTTDKGSFTRKRKLKIQSSPLIVPKKTGV